MKVDLDTSKFESFKYLESEENTNDHLYNSIKQKSGELVSDFYKVGILTIIFP